MNNIKKLKNFNVFKICSQSHRFIVLQFTISENIEFCLLELKVLLDILKLFNAKNLPFLIYSKLCSWSIFYAIN